MFKRSILVGLIAAVGVTGAVAQSPSTRTAPVAPETFAFSFDSDSGYLGVQTEEVTKENFARFGLRAVRGVAVGKVAENSPAAAAGLKDGDVIVKFNGDEVTSGRKLTRLVSEVDPDHQVRLTVLRNGAEQEITATVGKRPMPKFENGSFGFNLPDGQNKFEFKDLPQGRYNELLKDFPKGDFLQKFEMPEGEGKSFVWRSGQSRQIGIGVYPLTKQLGERYGVDGGVMVNDVRENSPAAKAGLKAGDVIVEVNGKAVKGDMDLRQLINEKKDGDVTVTLMRDRNRQTLTVTPEISKDSGFIFDSDGDGFFTPGQFKLTPPAAPAAPVLPGKIMSLLRNAREI